MILREYLYVDSATVRGILAQLDTGIVESETSAAVSQKTSTGGVKGFAEHAKNWGENLTTTKVLADAIFPQLESALESEGMLEDVSELLNSEESWQEGGLEDSLPAGKIIRLTAPGYLIDSRYIAKFLTSLTVTHHGLVNLEAAPSSAPDVALPPKAKKGRQAPKYVPLPGEEESLEGGIPLGDMDFGDGDPMSGRFLRGVAQVSRGMFSPGIHLAMIPEVSGAGTISVRLQEGRQFLDMDPDVLFAHYGIGAQEWTIVGTIGHHPVRDPNMDDSDFMENGVIRRGDFGRYVNKLGAFLGDLGFTDLPQAPGFSVLPWAVYRTLGTPEEA